MEQQTKSSKNKFQLESWALPIIICISVTLRLAAAVYMGNAVVELPGTADQLSYHTLALRVIDGYGFSFGQDWWPATRANEPTAHWSYLYTFFLAAVYKLVGPNPLAARLFQALVVGILQPYLTYQIASRLFSRTTAFIAAFIAAIYVYFIYYSGALMTEMFYITAILGSFLLALNLTRADAENAKLTRWTLSISLGLSLACVVLLRQLFLLFVPFLFLWIVLAGKKAQVWKTILQCCLAALVIAAAVLPFTSYNSVRFQRFVLLNTNSGFAFFWGNHPVHGIRFIPILTSEAYYAVLPKDKLTLDEAALDQELLRQGLQFIKDDPVRYILLSLSRIGPYFQFWPSPQSGAISNLSRVLSFGIFWPFMAYGLVNELLVKKIRFLRLVRTPQFLFFSFIFIYSAIHILTWTLIRYRLPVDAILVLFAAAGIADLIQRLVSTRKRIPVS